jgi:hypothetical protein
MIKKVFDISIDEDDIKMEQFDIKEVNNMKSVIDWCKQREIK